MGVNKPSFTISQVMFLLILGFQFMPVGLADEIINEESNRIRFYMNGAADTSVIVTKDNSSFQVGNLRSIFHFYYTDLALVETALNYTFNENSDSILDLEYLNANFNLNEYYILTSGKFLTPIGRYLGNLRPSWINPLPTDPVGFSEKDSVAPLNGVGLQLRIAHGCFGDKNDFTIFASNGPDLLSNLGKLSVSKTERNYDSNNSKMAGIKWQYLYSDPLHMSISYAQSKVGIGLGDRHLFRLVNTEFTFHDHDHFHNIKLNGEFVHSDLHVSEYLKRTEQAWYLSIVAPLAASKWALVVRSSELAIKDTPQKNNADVTNTLADKSTSSYEVSVGLNYQIRQSIIIKNAISKKIIDHNLEGNDFRIQLAFSL